MSLDSNNKVRKLPPNQSTYVLPGYDYKAEINEILDFLGDSEHLNRIWNFDDIAQIFPTISVGALDTVIFPKLCMDSFIDVLSNNNNPPSSKLKVQFKLSTEGRVFASEGGYSGASVKSMKDFVMEFLQKLYDSFDMIDVTEFIDNFYKRYGLDKAKIKFKIDELVQNKIIRCSGYERLSSNQVYISQPRILANIELKGHEYLNSLQAGLATPNEIRSSDGIGHKPI